MRLGMFFSAAVGPVLVALASCSSIPGVCDGPGACTDGVDGGEGGVDGAPDAPADVVAPPGCDASADAKDAPKCVVSDFGVFVDAVGGSDGNAGTKASPVKSITAALGKLAGKSRIYVCEGTYTEHVKLTSAVSLFGGFGCSGWSYTGTKAKLAPTSKGYGLEISGASSALIVADLDVTALDATDPGESSIAVFIAGSKDVKLRRLNVTAGKGGAATDASDPPSNLFSATLADLDGNPAPGATGGPAKTCACKSYGTSGGGKGGNAGNPAPNGENGVATPIPSIMPPRTSLGGDGYTAVVGFCTPGRAGSDGSPRAAGVGAARYGDLTASGWSPSAGAAGEAGNPGAGAGGGGGGDVNGSGGGGCGGCGGAGGLGGKGGGASVSIGGYKSSIAIEASQLTTALAGIGGKGSKGGGGGGGGGGAVGACGGGRGGNGAGGSGGGGGAGGISVTIVHAACTVSVDGATQTTLGQRGGGGSGGDPGIGGTNALGTALSGVIGSVGKDGVAQPTLDVTP